MKKTIVISAFPCSGKTTYFNSTTDEVILDSDSSEFSWLKNPEGGNTDIRDPEFPGNYIDHIKENLGKVDIIFVSSHEVVRNALKKHNIPYTLVFPNMCMRNEWERRMKSRNDTDQFTQFILTNWTKFINEMEMETFPFVFMLNLSPNEMYINSEVIDYARSSETADAKAAYAAWSAADQTAAAYEAWVDGTAPAHEGDIEAADLARIAANAAWAAYIVIKDVNKEQLTEETEKRPMKDLKKEQI